MRRYSIESRARKYVKGYGFLSFAQKHKKQLLDKGLDASKNIVHRAGEFSQTTKSNDDNIEIQEPVEEIIIPAEKTEEILNILRNVLYKCHTIKYLNY